MDNSSSKKNDFEDEPEFNPPPFHEAVQRPETSANQKRGAGSRGAKAEAKPGLIQADEEKIFRESRRDESPKNVGGYQYMSQELRPKTTGNVNLGKFSVPNLSRYEKPTGSLSRQQTAVNIQDKYNDYARLRPKNIIQDKEKLYEENIHQKQMINILKDDNLKLKTRVINLEREASKFEKMMHDVQNQHHFREVPSPKGNAESHLVLNLKQQIKELKADYKLKDDELQMIKRNVKYTRIQEIEVQFREAMQENIRLKTLLEGYIEERMRRSEFNEAEFRNQEEQIMQSGLIKTLRKDNEEMAKAIKILEENNFENEKKISDLEKKTKREASNYKKIINDREKELKQLKSEGGPSASMNKRPGTGSGTTKEEVLKFDLERKNQQYAELLRDVNHKDAEIIELRQKIRELKSLNERSNMQLSMNAIKDNDKGNHNIMEEHSGAQSEEVRKSERKDAPIYDPKDEVSKKVAFREINMEDDRERERPQERMPTMKSIQEIPQPKVFKKKVLGVKTEDVKDLGYELNMRLRTQGISFKDVITILWPSELLERGTATIKEMIQVLLKAPLGIEDEETATLLARYLIEENSNDYFFFDDTVSQQTGIIESILKKLIGEIMFWDEDTSRRLEDEIFQNLFKNKEGIREFLKTNSRKYNGNLSKAGLEEAKKTMDIQSLKMEHIEYIITKVYEQSGNLKEMPIDTMFTIFFPKDKEYVQTQKTLPSSKATPQSTKGQFEFNPIPKESDFKIEKKVEKKPVATPQAKVEEKTPKEEPFKREEPKKVEIKKEEPKKEDVKKEELKIEEKKKLKVEPPKAEEPNFEDRRLDKLPSKSENLKLDDKPKTKSPHQSWIPEDHLKPKDDHPKEQKLNDHHDKNNIQQTSNQRPLTISNDQIFDQEEPKILNTKTPVVDLHHHHEEKVDKKTPKPKEDLKIFDEKPRVSNEKLEIPDFKEPTSDAKHIRNPSKDEKKIRGDDLLQEKVNSDAITSDDFKTIKSNKKDHEEKIEHHAKPFETDHNEKQPLKVTPKNIEEHAKPEVIKTPERSRPQSNDYDVNDFVAEEDFSAFENKNSRNKRRNKQDTTPPRQQTPEHRELHPKIETIEKKEKIEDLSTKPKEETPIQITKKDIKPEPFQDIEIKPLTPAQNSKKIETPLSINSNKIQKHDPKDAKAKIEYDEYMDVDDDFEPEPEPEPIIDTEKQHIPENPGKKDKDIEENIKENSQKDEDKYEDDVYEDFEEEIGEAEEF